MFAPIGNKLTETQVVGARKSGHPLHLSERTSHQVNDVSQTQTKLDVRQALNKEHCFCHQMCYFHATQCVDYSIYQHITAIKTSLSRDLTTFLQPISISSFYFQLPFITFSFFLNSSMNSSNLTAMTDVSQEISLVIAVLQLCFLRKVIYSANLFTYHATTSSA